MKQTSKLCWFCEKKCYSFVSICPDCVKEKQKNTNQICFQKTNSVKKVFREQGGKMFT
jgi:hypothetical protein